MEHVLHLILLPPNQATLFHFEHNSSGLFDVVCESCIVELLNNLFREEMFSFALNPWVPANENIFSISNLPYEPISNQGKDLMVAFQMIDPFLDVFCICLIQSTS
jgi:hypothetical protein